MTPQATAGVIAPPPLIFGLPLVAAWLLGLRWPLPLLPEPWHHLGWLPLALGAAAVSALLAFRRAGTKPEPWKPTTALVTDGPYRWSRNPMYLGMAGLYVGLAMLLGLGWAVVLFPAVLATMHYGVIAREERYLERLFGAAYGDYRARVRRWI